MIVVSFFDHKASTAPTNVPFDHLRDVAHELREHDERPEKDGLLWSPAEYLDDATRGKRGVAAVHAYVLDLDHVTRDVACDVLDRVLDLGFGAWVYSTYSHTEDAPCLRIAVPVSRPVLADEWPSFWTTLRELFPETDRACSDASRIYYTPSAPSIEGVINEWFEGDAIDVDDVLAMAVGPAPVPVVEPEVVEDIASPELRAWALRKLEGYAVQIRETPYPGPIYPTINTAAFAVGRYTPHLLSRDEARSVLALALVDRCNLPAIVEKNETILDKALEDGAAVPWRPRPWLPLTERGLAARLLRDHGEHLRHVDGWGWVGYAGGRWSGGIAPGEQHRAIEALIKDLREEAERSPEGRAKQLTQAAKELGTLRTTRAVLGLAAMMPEFRMVVGDFDKDTRALVTANVVVDLRDGSTRPHSPGEYATTCAPVDYDPRAKAPNWKRFVLEVCQGDQELADYLQRAVGYSLFGEPTEHCLFFLHGAGRNGKSTFLEVLKTILGENAVVLPSNELLAKRGESHPTGLASLYGKRLAISSEVDEGRAWDESIVKQITGGDSITARRMREDPWTFRPSHTVWIAGNYRPIVRGGDTGIWSRLRLVPFDASFVGREDPTMREKLENERRGILAWAVKGAIAWWREGRRLRTPKAVEDAIAGYREDSDEIGSFLEERVSITGAYAERIDRRGLYRMYVGWCTIEGGKPMSSRSFCERVRRVSGIGEAVIRGVRCWTGISLRSSASDSSSVN